MSTFFKNPNPTPGSGTSFADVEVHFQTPICRLVLASKVTGGHIYLHNMPLSKVAVGGVIPVTGREAWLSLTEYPVLTFRDPIDSFFVSGDGVPPDFSLMGTSDIEDLNIEAVGNAIANPLPVNLTQQAGVVLSAPLADAPAGTEVATVVRNIVRKKTTIETITPLAANGVFTGAWHDAEQEGTVFVTVFSFSNVAGAANGTQIQQSDDNTDANFTQAAIQLKSGGITPGASTLTRSVAVIRARFWRVVYTNGGTIQASFKLTSCATNALLGEHRLGGNNLDAPASIGYIEAAALATQDNNASAPLVLSDFNASLRLYLSVAPQVYGGTFSGSADAARSGWTRGRTPTVFRQASTLATGSTAVWTPGASNKFRLLRFKIQITNNASQAVAGNITVKLLDSAADMAVGHIVFVPGAAGALVGDYDSGWIDLGQFGILSAVAGNVLNVNLSAALATGLCNVIVCGTEE